MLVLSTKYIIIVVQGKNYSGTVAYLGGGHAAMAPPWKVRKQFLTRYTVKNGISNLYILLVFGGLTLPGLPWAALKTHTG